MILGLLGKDRPMIKTVFLASVLVVLAVGCGSSMQQVETGNDMTAEQPASKADSPQESPPKMHPSWDQNRDGINDCEDDGSCDHTVDYSKPRKDTGAYLND